MDTAWSWTRDVRTRRGSRARTWRRLVCGIVAASAGLLLIAGGAAAKSGSTPIPTPSPTQQVLGLSLAGETYDYTWADVSGTGILGTGVAHSYLKDTPDQDPQEWSGVWLRGVLSDVETRSGIALHDDWKLRVSTVDSYVCALFVGDVKDAANNYLLAMDPVRGCNTEDPADATVWYDPTYVRICTNGDYGNTAFPARLVAISGSLTVLDSGGHEIGAPVTASLAVTSPTVSQTRATIAKRGRLALRAIATKAVDAPQAEPIVWKSGDVTIATVGATGTVTAVAPGATVITATSGVHAVTFTVKVVAKAVNATRVTLPTARSLAAGASARLTARLFPSGCTSTISWKSSSAGVAKVDRTGTVAALRKGKATITVRTSNGRTATCRLTVK